MTVYEVVPGGAGENGTLPSIAAAAAVVVSGDIVILHGGIYKERLVAKTPGVTWQAAEGETVILDGGWNGKTLPDAPGQVVITAEDVAIKGISVINSPGDGITVGKGGHNAIIANCRTDTTLSGGIICNAGETLRGVYIDDCVILRAGMSYAAGRKSAVSGSLNLIRCEGATVLNTVVAYGYGEGINIGKGSVGCMVSGCTVFDNAHLGIYFNRCQQCDAIDNLVFLTGFEERHVGSEAWPGGIIIGDEVGGKADSFEFSKGNGIIANLVVNCGTLIGVRNNKVTDGYNTSLDIDTLIAGNTLVAGPLTTRGINIGENLRKRPHGPARIQDNAVHFTHAAADGSIANNTSPMLRWECNGWTEAPPTTCAGAGDVVGFDLVNPAAAIANLYPTAEHTVNRNNYRPVAGSPLIGASTEGGDIGALLAMPTLPGPDAPDGGAILAQLEAIREQVAVIGMARDAALGEIDALRDLLSARTGKEIVR